ncbi:EAL and HDOD domain-containing protein [Pseudacidovorax sp. RU35E]|uniref:EAL and HDOD domain-containing protein n=1 Tax=Pseudacidovorax sp. RU35E TaxID=1907403 RepID=UPI000955DF61|nr:EAL domain-containing protein [Pseudacidovorax sp. RU35E]SIQ75093.1 EAL and modified HD-GYP domain-containing signal transduction protein [Pseudacidovorax sp. RU35E]
MRNDSSEALFVGRQPILGRDQQLRAYELLFRNGQAPCAEVLDGAQATATVIVNAFAELGMSHALDGREAYINVDAELLFSDVLELLPRQTVVLEVLESVPATAAVVQRCLHLHEAGFSLALDDVVAFDARTARLLPMVRVVKIDLLPLSDAQLAALVRQIRAAAPNVLLLAEKVETRSQFDACLRLGFSLFQGYHFARPTLIAGRRLGHSQQALMRLMGQLGADADSSVLEATLKPEPGLTMNLLRMANAAGSGATRTVTSLRDVIQVLGRRHLQRWVQLLLFATDARAGRASPLLLMAAARGRLMEAAAQHLRPNDPHLADGAFMVGMMSLMPALVGMPLADILGPLRLAPAIDEALRDGAGLLGELLRLAEASENGDFDSMAQALRTHSRLSPAQFNRAQAEALQWAHAIGREAPAADAA